MSSMAHDSRNLPITAGQWPALRDHVVAGRAVLPAAWMLVAAGDALRGPNKGSHPVQDPLQDLGQGLCAAAAPVTLTNVDFLAQLDISTLELGGLALLRAPDGGLIWQAAGSTKAPLASATSSSLNSGWPAGVTPGALDVTTLDTPAARDAVTLAYAQLAAVGNAYGPACRVLQALQSESKDDAPTAVARIHSQSMVAALDGCFQLALHLAAATGGVPRVVSGIETISLAPDWPETVLCQVRASTQADVGGGPHYEIQAVAPDGTSLLHVKGLHLAVASPAVADAALHVVSQVTVSALVAQVAEFGRPLGLRAEEGPFDQIQQTLLAGASALPAQTEELAVIVDPRSWFQPRTLTDGPERAAAEEAGATLNTLPDGTEVVQLNSFETDYLYAEIFDRGDYRPEGLLLSERPCVIDIGANIGMFALSVLAQRPKARVIALEPSPVAAPVLRANLAGRGDHVVLEAGAGARDHQMRFTHYAGASVFSGFHTDDGDDRKALEAAIRNEVRIAFTASEHGASDAASDELADQIAASTLDVRMAGSSSLVDVMSVSTVIDRLGLERIELLKIDAERSEWDILSGIREAHWPIIEQILVEVHEQGADDGSATASLDLVAYLQARDFSCETVVDAHLAGSGLSLIHASRADAGTLNANAAFAQHYLSCPLGLDRRVDEFVSALSAFRRGSAMPVQVLVGPLTGRALTSSHVTRHVAAALERLRAAVGKLPGCTLHLPDAVTRLYPDVTPAADPGEAQAGMRWSEQWQAAAGICLLRTMAARRRIPHKVIMVDADNTLWNGVCAEVGPEGVKVTAGHRLLQERLLHWRQAGGLLCLVSRNIAADVHATFERAAGMVLRWDDFAGTRIGWGMKSAAVRGLCSDLGIGCDSAIFIDDNELECAEVREGVPTCLVLQVPRTEAELVDFARHTWALDPAPGHATTDRTEQARIERERDEARANAPSLADFLASLQLVVEAAPPLPGDFERLSELTRRTNQFNIDPKGLDPIQVQSLAADPDRVMLAVRVRDRFGDYGLVGLASGLRRGPGPASEPPGLDVDQFLLSCRVLGRGVEQRVLGALMDAACQHGATCLRLRVRPTERNAPVRDFLQGLEPVEADGWWQIMASPERRAQLEQPASWFKPTTPPQVLPPTADTPSVMSPGRALSAIDRCYRDADWMMRTRMASASLLAVNATATGSVTGGDAADSREAVRRAWQEALGRPPQTLTEDFFAAGGSSLQLVRLISHLYRHGWPLLSVAEAYAAANVEGLARALDRRSAQVVQTETPEQPQQTSMVRGLSLTEQGLWFEFHRDPDSPVYSTAIPLRLDGPVAVDAVRDAWLRVCSLHAGLRTYYELDGAVSLARVRDSLPDAWVHVPHLVLADTEVEPWIDELASWPLDIEHACAQAHLATTETGALILVLRLHHIVADREAISLILDDLCRILAGAEPGPPTCHTRFASRVGARAGGGLRPKPAGVLFDPRWTQEAGSRRVTVLSPDVTAQLRAFAADARVSLQALLMAGLARAVRPGLAGAAAPVSIGTPVRLLGPLEGPAGVGNHVSLAAMDFGAETGSLGDLARTVHAWLASLAGPIGAPGLPDWVPAQPDLTLALHSRNDAGPISDMVLHGQPGRPFPMGAATARVLGRSPQAGQVPVGIDVLDDGETLSICAKSALDRTTDSLKVLAAFTSLLTHPHLEEAGDTEQPRVPVAAEEPAAI